MTLWWEGGGGLDSLRVQEHTLYDSQLSRNSRYAVKARRFFVCDFHTEVLGKLERRREKSGRSHVQMPWKGFCV